jgi:RNA polymerase sigma-70 factor, ECF subfamily
MQGERPGHSLQATALVHEAYLRHTGMQALNWQNRAQFFAISAQVMRRILVDSARARCARKRGGSQNAISLDEALVVSPSRPEQLLALDDALNKLAELDPRQSKIVEMRFFGGLLGIVVDLHRIRRIRAGKRDKGTPGEHRKVIQGFAKLDVRHAREMTIR